MLWLRRSRSRFDNPSDPKGELLRLEQSDVVNDCADFTLMRGGKHAKLRSAVTTERKSLVRDVTCFAEKLSELATKSPVGNSSHVGTRREERDTWSDFVYILVIRVHVSRLKSALVIRARSPGTSRDVYDSQILQHSEATVTARAQLSDK